MRRFTVVVAMILLATTCVACVSTQAKTWHTVDPDVIIDAADGLDDSASDDPKRQTLEIPVHCTPGQDAPSQWRADDATQCQTRTVTASDQLRIMAPYRQPITLQVSEFQSRSDDEIVAIAEHEGSVVQLRERHSPRQQGRLSSFGLGVLTFVIPALVLGSLE